MRKIRVINSNLGKVKNVETDATTWGQLKEQISDMFRGEVNAVVKENQVSLELSSATLPEGDLAGEDKDQDFTLFVVTKESKAGVDDYDRMGFNQLRAECAQRTSVEGNAGNYGSSNEMRRKLREDDRTNSPSHTTQLDRIEAKLDSILQAIESAPIEDGAEQVSEEDDGMTDEERKAWKEIQATL